MGNLRERDNLEDLGVDGIIIIIIIIIKWILQKEDGRSGLSLSGLRQRQVATFCEHGDELPQNMGNLFFR